MTSGGHQDRLDDYARALAVFEAYVERRRRGAAESEADLLDAHDELREPLRALLDGDRVATCTETAADPRPAPPTWSDLPEEGEDFGAYRVLRALGRGGMGAVFLAVHRELGRKVALKLIRPERLFADRARERFWREAVAISKLDHAAICPVYDVGEVEGIPYMTMRYIDGSSLATLIGHAVEDQGVGSTILLAPSREEPASPSGVLSSVSSPTTRKEVFAVVRVFEEVARGLHHAHEQGIIHRDVKPANIMVDAEGRPMILDFGLARAEDSDQPPLTMTGDVAGTPLYMAPEQVAPRGRELDRTVDVYSLGATLYECLTLRRMIDGESLQEQFDCILNREPVPPSRVNPTVPRDLEVVLQKAIDKDPRRRYATALDLAEDLRRVRSFEPVLARPAGPLLRLRRWAQRYPWAASFVALLAVALAAGVLVAIQAGRARAEFDLVETMPLLRMAEESERELHRLWPDNLEAMRLWREEHGIPLQRRRQALPAPGSAEQGDERAAALIADLDRFLRGGGDGSEGPDARVRRLLAERAKHDAVAAGHRERWDRAIAAIAAHPRYRGLRLVPQVGLVPLRQDPQSGLWEFWHVPSGEIPETDARTGALEVGGDTGLVFVLVPPGEFWMGSQGEDPAAPNHDEESRANEQPVVEVSLAAFFLSKYEMAQGQWQRLTDGDLPSGFRAGKKTKKLQYLFTLAHPVEQVSWDRCDQVLGWYGLGLPTEAQWEYACRAGTDTPWWMGDEREDLLDPASGKALLNIADRTLVRDGGYFSDTTSWRDLEDGFSFLAPVASYRPNAFGLYQVHGNVHEWCRERYTGYDRPVAPGDGFRRDDGDASHVVRGGSWDGRVYYARAAYRGQKAGVSSNVGVRPARRIHD